MTKFKVALRADARPLSWHNYISNAISAVRKAGSKYNVYEWVLYGDWRKHSDISRRGRWWKVY